MISKLIFFFFQGLPDDWKFFLLKFKNFVRVFAGKNGREDRHWEVRVLSIPENTGCGGMLIDREWENFVAANNIVVGDRLDVYHDHYNIYIRIFNADGTERLPNEAGSGTNV